jgi:SAM-dependent methyltransferase
MSDNFEHPTVIFGSDREQEILEQGIYADTLTTPDRYVNEKSVDSMIYDCLSDVLEDGGSYRILDIGSSSGEALETLVERLEEEKECYFETLALDVNAKMVKRCNQNSIDHGILAAGQCIPLTSDSVDIIISNQLHLNSEDLEEVVEEANRVLDSEGYAVLSTGYEKLDYRGIHKGRIP